MNAYTIYLDSDPACLGTESTEDDMDRYIENLTALLESEFDAEIVVRRQIGGWSWRCRDSAEVDERIREIESGDEWISLIGESEPDAVTLDTPTADIVDHLTAAGIDWHGGPIPEPGDQSRADSAHAACVVGTLSIWPDEAQGCWMWRDGGHWGSLDSYGELDRLVREAQRS
jgi:hypothetical protein